MEELEGQGVAEPVAVPLSREAAEVADGAPGATVHAALAAAAEEATELDKDVRFEDDCIVVAQSDIIDAMAEFIAQCVVLNPNAAKLSPEKLQAALTKSIHELQRGQVATLLEWSKRVYRGGAWGYGVAHAYTHPWVRGCVLAPPPPLYVWGRFGDVSRRPRSLAGVGPSVRISRQTDSNKHYIISNSVYSLPISLGHEAKGRRRAGEGPAQVVKAVLVGIWQSLKMMTAALPLGI